MYCKRPESLVFVNKNKVNFTGGSPPCCSCRLLAYFFISFLFRSFFPNTHSLFQSPLSTIIISILYCSLHYGRRIEVSQGTGFT